MSDDLVKEWDNHIHVMSEVYAHANKMADRIEALEAELEAAGELLAKCRPFVGYEANVDDLLSEIDGTLAELKGRDDE